MPRAVATKHENLSHSKYPRDMKYEYASVLRLVSIV